MTVPGYGMFPPQQLQPAAQFASETTAHGAGAVPLDRASGKPIVRIADAVVISDDDEAASEDGQGGNNDGEGSDDNSDEAAGMQDGGEVDARSEVSISMHRGVRFLLS